MSENTNNTEETRELTPAELEASRQKMEDFYEKSIPRLEKQLKYEELLTKIDKERFERFRMQFQITQAMAPDPKDDGQVEVDPPGDKEPGQQRRLKKTDQSNQQQEG